MLPEYEGKGVGGKLMALAEEWLAASGCKRAWLTTDLNTTLRAYGFYRKRGWTDWKIEKGLRWMELSLPPDRSGTIVRRVSPWHRHRDGPLN